MKKKRKKLGRKLLGFLLTLAMVVGLMPGMGITAQAADGDTSTYTLTIPSTLTVSGSGWNATEGISATGTLADGKKLTVTASSANSWALKSGDNSVGYKLATASTDTEATTSWEFTELSSTATKKDMGIIVEDYCQAYARWREAEEYITEHGTTDGSGRTLPQVAVAQTYLGIMKEFAGQLGLVPASGG
jgi:hypothetical protein